MGGEIEFLKVEAECPHCFQTDVYIGGEENRWVEIIYSDPTEAKDREKVYRLVEEALRKRLLQLQRQNLELQEQLGKLRTQVKNLQKENKRLSDLAYAKMPADERRDLR